MSPCAVKLGSSMRWNPAEMVRVGATPQEVGTGSMHHAHRPVGGGRTARGHGRRCALDASHLTADVLKPYRHRHRHIELQLRHELRVPYGA